MDNPSNEAATRVTEENRIPMSLPHLKLSVPEIEGYVLHWFADRPGRISRARAAGYQFVGMEEVRLNNFGLASDLEQTGNTDLGTRVSVHGGEGERGGAERLYLMKIKTEWYDKDMALREQAADKVVRTLRDGLTGAEKDAQKDAAQRYVKNTDNLFTKHKRRSNG